MEAILRIYLCLVLQHPDILQKAKKPIQTVPGSLHRRTGSVQRNACHGCQEIGIWYLDCDSHAYIPVPVCCVLHIRPFPSLGSVCEAQPFILCSHLVSYPYFKITSQGVNTRTLHLAFSDFSSVSVAPSETLSLFSSCWLGTHCVIQVGLLLTLALRVACATTPSPDVINLNYPQCTYQNQEINIGQSTPGVLSLFSDPVHYPTTLWCRVSVSSVRQLFRLS